MRLTFQCAGTENLFLGRRVKRFANIEKIAMRKLQQLHAATSLDFLRIPPGNELEALKGDWAGQHGITVYTTLRLAAFFGTDAQSWGNLQTHYDTELAR